MNDQDVTVKLSLMHGILGYLGTRPYGEVFQIIQALQEQVSPQVAVPQEAVEPK
jgi:hypothetical protein